MSNNSEEQKTQEVDLVPIFRWIGNGIKGFFIGIVNVVKAIGHFLILFLIFIKKNIILLILLSILGAALGYYLDQQSKKLFTAEVRVRPYFESTSQLFANINSYNSLIEREEFEELAAELDITAKEAKSLSGLEIEADYNDTELLVEYDEAARAADSVALENYSFEGFKESKREIDYENYLIIITGSDGDVIKKIIPKVVEIEDNSAIEALRMASLETVDFNIAAMNYQLTELDSLISSFQKALSQKETQEAGVKTNLYMGNSDSSVKIPDLFNEKNALLNRLEEARVSKRYFENTVNIVSQYVKLGSLEKPHYKIKLAIIFFGLGLIIALVPVVWRFLNAYEANHK